MNILIGRKKELSLLRTLATSNKSEFIAVFGRRRVGKIFLIRKAFDQEFTFQLTTFRLKTNEHSSGLVQNDLTMDDLFVEIKG